MIPDTQVADDRWLVEMKGKTNKMNNKEKFKKFIEQARLGLSLAQAEALHLQHNCIVLKIMFISIEHEADDIVAKVVDANAIAIRAKILLETLNKYPKVCKTFQCKRKHSKREEKELRVSLVCEIAWPQSDEGGWHQSCS